MKMDKVANSGNYELDEGLLVNGLMVNGLIFNKETVESLIKYCFAVEKKLDTAIEALELYSTIENMHIDVEHSGWGSDVEVLEYHNEEHRNFGATAKEALKQIKGEE